MGDAQKASRCGPRSIAQREMAQIERTWRAARKRRLAEAAREPQFDGRRHFGRKGGVEGLTFKHRPRGNRFTDDTRDLAAAVDGVGIVIGLRGEGFPRFLAVLR